MALRRQVGILLGGSALAVAMFGSAAAQAQSMAGAANAAPVPDANPQDIIVTAQKREQRLQDVGISINVQSGAQLQTAGVHDISQLVKVVPSLSIGRNQFGFPLISLRGVNFNVPYISAQPTVSTYVDQALLPYPATTQGIFLDVDHVETLKGPQGTLFGANNTGGAINVVPNKPTSTLQAGFTAEANNFGGVHLDGYVSGPISETLRARLAVSTDQFGAWQKCYFGCHEKNGDANRGAARLLLDWTPTDRLKISVNLNANYDHGEPQVFRLQALSIQVPPGYPGLANYPLPPKDNRYADFSPGYPSHDRDRTYQAVLRADYDLGGATLTSLTNYVNTRRYIDLDDDATALPLGFNQGFGTIKSFNQEVRLSGKIQDPNITYVVGASYQHDRILDGGSAHWEGYSGIPVGANALLLNPVRYRSAGVFGNVEWEFLPRLTLTVGGRYAWLKEHTGGCFADGGNGILAATFGYLSNLLRSAYGLPGTDAFVPGGCITLDDRPELLDPANPSPNAFLPYDANLTQKEHNFSWKAGLNYKPTQNTLIYGLVSRGYKAGGFPPGYNTVASQFVQIKQEELTDYEVGAKLDMLDHKLRLNIDGFYYDYRNKQFLTLEPGLIGDQFALRNIPKSSVKGIEGDVTLRPVSELTLRAAVTYIKTKVGDFDVYTGIITGNKNIKGNEFNLAPPVSGNFDAEYRVPIDPDRHMFVGFSGTFNSRTFADLGETPRYRLPGYATFDARLGVESVKGWTASVWIRNLNNAFYINNITTGGDVLMSSTGLPRTFGGTFSVKFR